MDHSAQGSRLAHQPIARPDLARTGALLCYWQAYYLVRFHHILSCGFTLSIMSMICMCGV
jgi:hypothetical protein